MLIPVAELVANHGLRDVTGVLHLGGHHGEEADQYDQRMPWVNGPRVVWVEGNPAAIGELRRTVEHRPGHEIICALVDDQPREVTFHVASNGESSSVLDLGTHAIEHPEVSYIDEWQATTTSVDLLADSGWDDLTFVNLDLQGLELRALQGATKFLEHCDYVYAEVNREPLYQGCPMIAELDQHLRGFRRVATVWTRHGWGDALWSRP